MYANVLSVVPAFACVTVNVLFPTDATYVVATAPAALAVVGVKKTYEPDAIYSPATTVLVAPAVRVKVPVALERPCASCLMA